MKKVTISFTMRQLFATVVALIVLGSVYAFSASQGYGFEQINQGDANQYYLNHVGSITYQEGTTTAVCINQDMFSAMSEINNQTSPVGFRCYFGQETNGNSVAIVVGVDGEGKDAANYILKSTGDGFAICPTICDVTSPIIQN